MEVLLFSESSFTTTWGPNFTVYLSIYWSDPIWPSFHPFPIWDASLFPVCQLQTFSFRVRTVLSEVLVHLAWVAYHSPALFWEFPKRHGHPNFVFSSQVYLEYNKEKARYRNVFKVSGMIKPSAKERQYVPPPLGH